MCYFQIKSLLSITAKVAIVLFIITLSLVACSEDKLALVKEGFSNYEIVFMGNSTESQYEAAELLKNYIHKISGASLTIVDESSQNIEKQKIYIGNIAGESLKKNELSIKVDGQNLILAGGSDEAIRNSVLVFLEKYLACKWFSPTVEEIPIKSTIEIEKSLSYNYSPAITTRTVHSRLFYENHNFAIKHKVTTNAFPTYVPNARVHTFHRFIPEEKFYIKHPEYFALRNGSRLPTQLCLTNKEVLEIVKDSVASLFKNNLDAEVISVSQDDNTQYCQCENCSEIDKKEGSPSGTMIQFVNKIADNFPDKTISTLAYQYTRKPSKTKPRKNVLITLCSIECDRSAPISEKCADFAEDLEGWGKLTDNIRIWDYTTQFTNFLSPFPNILTLQPNIQLFRDNNAKWVFEQHSNNPSELFELRSYIMAKLLWNPNLDVDTLITEFTNGYYKEAGVFVKKYIDLIHSELAKNTSFFLFLYGDPSQAFDSYLSPELLQTYQTFFDAAEKAVIAKPEIIQRVRQARLSIDYAILEASKKNLSNQFSLVNLSKDGSKRANPTILITLDKFYNSCKNADITLMNEMGFTVDEYYNSYKKTIEVASKPNKATGKRVTLLSKPKKYANENPQTLTDGALGGNNFYANWLGFEGNHLEAIIDLEDKELISSISTAFLQITNHVVFFPESVDYYYSNDNNTFTRLGIIINDKPLVKSSKVNDIKYFNITFPKVSARYVKIVAKNMKYAPYWHHAARLPAWIFADEIIID